MRSPVKSRRTGLGAVTAGTADGPGGGAREVPEQEGRPGKTMLPAPVGSHQGRPPGTPTPNRNTVCGEPPPAQPETIECDTWSRLTDAAQESLVRDFGVESHTSVKMDSDDFPDEGDSTGVRKRNQQDGTPKKNKRARGESATKHEHRDQKYRKQWEADSRFCQWISSVRDKPKRAACTLCGAEMNAEISVLKRHADSSKHLKQSNAIGPTVKIAEIRKCAFLAENNIAIRVIEPMVETDKACYPDSKIAQGIQLGCTKATNIINNVIGPCHLNEMAEKLKTKKFSVLIDESTDVGSTKSMVVNVRYHEGNETVSKFWKLVQVFCPQDADGTRAEGTTARRLFNMLIESFTDEGVPAENIIAFGSDGCNTMFGAHNSVAQRMQEMLPGITLVKCICHSLHLCTSEACKELPQCIEDLVRNVYGVFKSSCKRQSEFREFQDFANADPSLLLLVVNRILEQWDALKSYFTQNAFEERLVAADSVLQFTIDPTVKQYYHFLQWVLPKFVDLNEIFQSDHPLIAVMFRKMSAAYKDLLLLFMDKNYVERTPLEAIDPSDSSKYIPLNQMYLGVKVLSDFAGPDFQSQANKAEMEQHFRQRCRAFLVKGCNELCKRFDFSSSSAFAKMSCLMPTEALSSNRPLSLYDLTKAVPRICDPNDLDRVQILDDQWRLLVMRDFTAELKGMEPDKFWSAVRDHKDFDSETPFKELANFALEVLSLPHSNAACERCFSKVNLLKTKLRNRLLVRTLNGLLLASQCAEDGGGSCKFPVTKEMIAAMNVYNLNLKKKGQLQPEIEQGVQAGEDEKWEWEVKEEDFDIVFA